LVSKAFLIYQKFLAPNSYIEVKVLPSSVETVKDIIQNELQQISEGKESRVTRALFDDIVHELEEKLAAQLFQPFFKSHYYAELKERSALVEMRVIDAV
jgi:hypothetical protein